MRLNYAGGYDLELREMLPAGLAGYRVGKQSVSSKQVVV